MCQVDCTCMHNAGYGSYVMYQGVVKQQLYTILRSDVIRTVGHGVTSER